MSKENEAILLNRQGANFFKQGKYKEAAAKQQLAYQTWPYNDNNKQIIKKNWYYALSKTLNEEGDNLYAQQNYSAAQVKYHQAKNKCPNFYAEDINNYKNNEANALYQQGMQLLGQGDHSGAKNKFKGAYKTCTADNESRDKFKAEERYCRAKLLSNDGKKLLEHNDYSGAITNIRKRIINVLAHMVVVKICLRIK